MDFVRRWPCGPFWNQLACNAASAYFPKPHGPKASMLLQEQAIHFLTQLKARFELAQVCRGNASAGLGHFSRVYISPKALNLARQNNDHSAWSRQQWVTGTSNQLLCPKIPCHAPYMAADMSQEVLATRCRRPRAAPRRRHPRTPASAAPHLTSHQHLRPILMVGMMSARPIIQSPPSGRCPRPWPCAGGST